MREFPDLDSWNDTLLVKNNPRSKIAHVYLHITYYRVHIGKVYQEEVGFGNSRRLNQIPVRVETHSSNISASLVAHNYRYANGSSFIGYSVDYKYKPAWPIGTETREIDILSGSGAVFGIIDLRAHKTIGYFPQRKWFGMPEHGFSGYD